LTDRDGSDLDARTREAVTELIEKEEGAAHRLGGPVGAFLTAVAVAVSVFHLYAAYDIVSAHVLRPVHVGLVLFLSFLLYPVARAFRDTVRWWDWLLALAALGVTGYILWQGEALGDRAVTPTTLDAVVGGLLVLMVLEAARRTTGAIMPGVAVAFIIYALVGPHLPRPWTHRGFAPEDLIGHLYMTLEGIFGSTVDVSSSLIILFTIFGAILQHSGAGSFFVNFSFAAMGGRRNSAGRAVLLSSFLMGGPSGSGVATTVTIGTVAYPLLMKAGYGRNAAGGLLAAGGLGAIISPPVLGAAAFLIAEFLKISYLDVLRMAVIPTVLYYFSILVMVEIDSAKHGGGDERLIESTPLGRLALSYWFHFLSLVSIVAFMLLGFSPVTAVFWATMLAILVSFLRRDTALVPAKLVRALEEGTTGVLSVAATCAAAGIIVGVVTLTGLAQRFADIIISYAYGSLFLTTLYTALIVWVVGLAVPITASYIMCAIIAAPALIKLGVPDYAAHMFVFYYAVLSEVSPPTALSPFAAAAITGGSPYRTTMESWKYTMPAFLVPFVFVLDPGGLALLLSGDKLTTLQTMVMIAQTGAGIAALGVALQGWLFRKTSFLETGLFLAAGLMLTFSRSIGSSLGPQLADAAWGVPVLALALAALGILSQRRRPA